MRLHQRIATTLESEPGADDELLAELAYHFFECAWAGNAAKAVDYCRRAADQAMARLAYEGAADLYGKAVHALEDLDEELPDRDEQRAELLVARCEALLAAGDAVAAKGAVSQLLSAAGLSGRLAAWGACFDGQLSMLTDPERLDEIESALTSAAQSLAQFEDAAGEAKAHTVRAAALARLGRIGDAETALDQALTAARRAREHRRVNAVLAGAPLAALWGPNPVPRAGGRCLDVVRLLRITTGSPVVEATSTRCQGVLDAFRGRAAAGRQLIESARRSLTELGMRHALLEVDQFAGIVELVADSPAAAEPHLRRAYNGFRRMGLDADTAETAALLARACLALDKDSEADELCAESERLAGHALKAAIAWRSARAQLLSRTGDHGEARRIAEEAVAIAERTDLLVDHGDACLALATVLSTAGDTAGARAVAERAANLYDLKGAAALAENARSLVTDAPSASVPDETTGTELDNLCLRVLRILEAAVVDEDWGAFETIYAPNVLVESRRKIVGWTQSDLPSSDWPREARRLLEVASVGYMSAIAVRGERLAVVRLELGTEDRSPGAPNDESVLLVGLDGDGRIALQISFELDDIGAAMAELDSQHARFDEGLPGAPSASPDNACVHAIYRLDDAFRRQQWDEVELIGSSVVSVESRRAIVGFPPAELLFSDWLNEGRRYREIGSARHFHRPVAVRGQRLAVMHLQMATADATVGAPKDEMLVLFELDGHSRIASEVFFDADDLASAITELDTRYLVGEAASHAQTWSTVVAAFTALNRNELPVAADDYVIVDHQLHHETVGRSGLVEVVRVNSELTPDSYMYFENVHRMTDLGVVVTLAMQASSSDGFDARWRVQQILTQEGGVGRRCEVFNEADLDDALARFDELSRPMPTLENAAVRVYDSYLKHFDARDWDAVGQSIGDNHRSHDRRRIANEGSQHGRAAEIESLKSVADLGATNSFVCLATRGDRLALCRVRGATNEAFYLDVLRIAEIDANELLVARVVFDPDDLDAALAELDARYAAGEAAQHSQVWSVIAGVNTALNKRNLPATTSNWVNIDHRRVTPVASDKMAAFVHASWEDYAQFQTHIEAVHRLNATGAVVTWAGHATSQKAFEAEWRVINVLIVDGDLISRTELFDEIDVEAALARFDEVSRGMARLENTASRVYEHVQQCFSARDWDGMAEAMASEIRQADHRRVVNAEEKHGREAAIAEAQAVAEFVARTVATTTVATRGERLALIRGCFGGSDQRPDAFRSESLIVAEIDSNEKLAAYCMFELEDFESAFFELDTRYLAGEAAPYAKTWSTITQAYGGMARGEFPATSPDLAIFDHRRVTPMPPDNGIAYLQASWDVAPEFKLHIESVHRLTQLGAVFTRSSTAISNAGFEAEWRASDLIIVDGDRISHGEIFDESELDSALARFDELSRPVVRLENVASHVYERSWAYFANGDWTAGAELIADDVYSDDRRRVVGGGIRRGRESAVADAQAAIGVGLGRAVMTVHATRGSNLALVHCLVAGADTKDFHVDALQVIRVDADERMATVVSFEPDDVDAAFAELDARYLAGEALTYAHTWSSICNAFAAVNRREYPEMTPDCVSIDHRQLLAFGPGEVTEYLQASLDDASELTISIEAVHRLNNIGAVFSHSWHNTSQAGFDAEWRVVGITTLEGDLINRCELFDEADLDAALARFDELSHQSPHLDNAATRQIASVADAYNRRDLDAYLAAYSADAQYDDRRKLLRDKGPVDRAYAREMFSVPPPGWQAKFEPVATRGNLLALSRYHFFDGDDADRPVILELVAITELDKDGLVTNLLLFDPNDVDAAFAELEARYIAGEAATHAHAWSVVAEHHAAFNRRELPDDSPELIDHRPLVTIQSGDAASKVLDMWDFTPDVKLYIEAVHRLSDIGAVFTQVTNGSSQTGFDAQWRIAELVTVKGDSVRRGELFEESDLDAALARFDELSRQSAKLENAATRQLPPISDAYNRRDVDGYLACYGADATYEDRRKLIRDSGRLDSVFARGLLFTAPPGWQVTVEPVALRGDLLVLSRCVFIDADDIARPITLEVLTITDADSDGRIQKLQLFDVDDIDAAFAELEARYVAGEAASHARTWSAIVHASDAFNRREMFLTTPDWITIDHRRITAFEPGDMSNYVRATWDVATDVTHRVVAVHRLTALGAVLTQVSTATSKDNFDAEWHEVVILTLDGNAISGCEIFDEQDLEAALAKFDELNSPATRLENSATAQNLRLADAFNRRDLDGFLGTFATDAQFGDRRRVLRYEGPLDADFVRGLFTDEAKSWRLEVKPLAIRGDRLSLCRHIYRDEADPGRPVAVEALNLTEVGDDALAKSCVVFDPDDIDAAFAELDAMYIAGEAKAYGQTWAVVSEAYSALNRREVPARAHGWASGDHRKLPTFQADDLPEYLRATFNLTPDLRIDIEAVHRLSPVGAVVTHRAYGTASTGFDAEWRMVVLVTVDGERSSRGELFDEADLATALTRFDELNTPASQLDNSATRQNAPLEIVFNRRDMDGYLAWIGADACYDDRRRGLRSDGPIDAAYARALLFDAAESWRLEIRAMAVRGDRLALNHYIFRDSADVELPVAVEALIVIEVTDDALVHRAVIFDSDDVDAALAELDARFVAAEGSPHARTWSLITRSIAAFNNHELPPTTFDLIDHRRVVGSGSSDLTETLQAAWAITQNIHACIEVVHRLSEHGAVISHSLRGTSQDGFDFEWRVVDVFIVDCDAIARCEMFDEADLDTAIARFDEISKPTRQLDNAVIRLTERFTQYLANGDWDAMGEIYAADFTQDDRRRIVGAGIRHGRDAEVEDLRVFNDIGLRDATFASLATRGDRLALTRMSFLGGTSGPEAVRIDLLGIAEVDADGRVTAAIAFDPDDIDAAFAELDALYIAGEATPHARLWTLITRSFDAFNNRELPPDTLEWIDRRRLVGIGASDLAETTQAVWEITTNICSRIESVHRLTDRGAVITHSMQGSSQEGFDFEWRVIDVFTVDGDAITRCEMFDEADLDVALTEFDQSGAPDRQ